MAASTALPFAVVALVAVAVYLPALFNDFAYDDLMQVRDNPWIRDLRHLPEIFTTSVWSFQDRPVVSNYYRPLMHVTYSAAYLLFGLAPWAFHLINVLFHAGSCVLVYRITHRVLTAAQPEGMRPGVRQTTGEAGWLSAPLAAALLFATHPIHTEAVAWVAGLPEVSFTFFALLSFLFHRRSVSAADKGHGLSLACFFAAALCKETALTLPILLFASDRIRPERHASLSDLAKRYVPFAVLAGFYLALRFHALRGFAPERRWTELDAYQQVLNAFPLFGQYLHKLIFPVHLNAFHVLHPVHSIREPRAAMALVVAAAWLAGSVVAWKRSRGVGFGLLAIAIPILPVLYVPVLGENAFAERYLYLPSAGFVALLAMALLRATAGAHTVRVVVLGTLIGLYSAGTISRIFVWRDDYTLFTDTVEKSPDGTVPRSNLGTALLKRGMYDQAAEQYAAALRLQPTRADDRYNLGLAYERQGLTDAAIEQYRIATRAPGFAKPHNNLGGIYARTGRMKQAIEHFRTAVRLQPNYAMARHNLGDAYADTGLNDEAVEQYEAALRLGRDTADLRSGLGLALFATGRTDDAIEQYVIAVRMDPSDAATHSHLAKAYERKGLLQAAVTQYEAALRFSPDDPAYRADLLRARGLTSAPPE